jgi:hypothetical protein
VDNVDLGHYCAKGPTNHYRRRSSLINRLTLAQSSHFVENNASILIEKDILAIALPKHVEEKTRSLHLHWKDSVSQILTFQVEKVVVLKAKLIGLQVQKKMLSNNIEEQSSILEVATKHHVMQVLFHMQH